MPSLVAQRMMESFTVWERPERGIDVEVSASCFDEKKPALDRADGRRITPALLVSRKAAIAPVPQHQS